MIIRTGFVSNSSSSNFIIIGKYIKFKDIFEYNNIYCIGKELSEGQDIFNLSAEIYNYILMNRLSYKFKFILKNCDNNIKIDSNSDNKKITIETLEPSIFTIFNLEKDYDSCENILDIENRYLYDDKTQYNYKNQYDE